jgi:ABC-type nitrate/sulfonate/bicarbonate transport system substrate-binding protein
MDMIRFAIVLAVTFVFAALSPVHAAETLTKITVGKTTGGSGFHIPTYIAMDKGFFKAEGLDASFVTLTGKALVTAGITGTVNFIPIPSGGSQAALSGAQIRYVVGESLRSQWIIVTRPDIAKVQDLKDKTLGYGRPGSADYDEGAAVLSRAFKMDPGKDYKVISFPGEPERIAALINGDIQGALLSVPSAPRVVGAGMKILVRTGDYIQRAGGTLWTTKDYVDANPDTVKKFIRAIAKAVMYYRDNKAGSLATLKEYLAVQNDKDAGIVWEETHNAFGAELPKDKFAEIFESRRQVMVKAKQWAPDKPLPDPEQFLVRTMLDTTLKEMKYVPTKLDAPSN